MGKKEKEVSEKKYELTDETKTLSDGTVLHRIRAVKDFSIPCGINVRSGDLGGFVGTEDNLSHYDSAWVFDGACVYDRARVYDDAFVYDEARVYGKAFIGNTAEVCGKACVYDSVCVFEKAFVNGNAKVYGNAVVRGSAEVCGSAEVYDLALVFGNARVCGSAKVCGSAEVCGEARICGDAVVNDSHDYTVFKNDWSSGRWFTYTRSDKMWTVGCFHGTGDTLIAKAYKDSELSGQCYEAIVRAQEAIDKSKVLFKCTPDGDVKSHGSVN